MNTLERSVLGRFSAIADYEPVTIDLGDAAELVGTAAGFVTAIEQFVTRTQP
jgi:hypothetical protein